MASVGDHALAKFARQLLVGVPCCFPLLGCVLVPVRPDVLPGDQDTVRWKHVGEAPEYSVQPRNVVRRGEIDDEVEAVFWELCGVGVHLVIPQRELLVGRRRPSRIEQVVDEVDANRLLDDSFGHERSFDPAVAQLSTSALLNGDPRHWARW